MMSSCELLHINTTSVGQPAKPCIHQFCADAECRLEDLRVMADHIYPIPPLGQDMTQGQFF